jgi:hypothetical protein
VTSSCPALAVEQLGEPVAQLRGLVPPVRVLLEPAAGPVDRFVGAAGVGEELGDLEVVVGAVQIVALDGDELVGVPGGDRDGDACLLQPEVLPPRPGVIRLGPRGFDELAVAGDPLDAERVRVGRGRPVERVEGVRVDLELEQPLGQRAGIGPGTGDRGLVEPGDPVGDVGEPATRVVDAAQRGLGPTVGVLGQRHHGVGVAGGEQLLDVVEQVVDTGRPLGCVSVLDEPAAGGERARHTLAPGPHVRRRDGASDRAWTRRPPRSVWPGARQAARERERRRDRVLAQRALRSRGTRAEPDRVPGLEEQLDQRTARCPARSRRPGRARPGRC